MKRVLLLVTVLSFLAFAMSNGAPTLSCTMCHTDAANRPAAFVIKGLPKHYIPGHVYNITIKITKGPKCDPTVGCGGFAVHVSAGKLIVTDPKDTFLAQNPVDGVYITHTLEGHLKREWTFAWKAPNKPEPVKFKISVIAANGDGTFTGDAYAGKTITIYPVGWKEQGQAQAAQAVAQVDQTLYYIAYTSLGLSLASLAVAILTYISVMRKLGSK